MLLAVPLPPLPIAILWSEARYPAVTDSPIDVIVDPESVIVDLLADSRR